MTIVAGSHTEPIEALEQDEPYRVEYWGRIVYPAAMERLQQTQAARIAGVGPDSLFYLEHDPVYTYGRATEPGDLAAAPVDVPQIEVARGGLATYHGPGQLVGYLVLNLAEREDGRRPDIHSYLRAIEEGLITFLQAEYELPCTRREGFTGVWTHGFRLENSMPRKLASIGVSARRWVTSHGFALNLAPDMSAFRAIVPCGITDAEISSIVEEFARIGKPAPEMLLMTLAPRVHAHLIAALNREGWLLTKAGSVPNFIRVSIV